jgi:uncharacterized protein YbjT (DUF2867 family)
VHCLEDEQSRAMRVLIFGASGMVGGGVLRECLADPGVEQVISVARTASGSDCEKVKEIVHGDFLDFTKIEASVFGDIDAAFFCLGVSSSGMSETDYVRVTYEYTLAAARALFKISPDATFVYVSGAGADSTERSRTMWKRVRGHTENALLALSPKTFVFRPALIQPRGGAVSRTPIYRLLYRVTAPILPLLRALLPRSVTDTEQLGRAMLHVARNGAPHRLLYSDDINALGKRVS